MADREIVIKISEENYELAQRFCKGTIILDEFLKPKVGRIITTRLMKAIGKGTPLPKGHGRLIDADVFIDGFEDYYELCELVNSTPTIIEADKEEE